MLWLGTDLGDHESFDLTGMGNMGADAKVDHGATAVDGSGGSVRNFGLDKILLILVVL